MTESQWLSFIRSALRSKWLRWKPRSDAIKLAQQPYKGANKRQKYTYTCAICKGELSSGELEVDHYPKDAGSILRLEDIGEFCNNLFCEVDNLRVVHKSCHKIYTHAQKLNVSFEESAMLKEVIRIFKEETQQDILVFINSYLVDADCSNAIKRKKLVESILRSIT